MRRSLVGIVCAFFAAACTAPTSAPPTPEYDVDGTMTLGTGGSQNLDPQTTDQLGDVRVIDLVFEPLLGFDPSTLRPTAAAAPLPTVSADGRTYHFTLRPDIQYSDGTAVKASDYAYGLSRLCDPAVSSPYSTSVLSIVGCQEWAGMDAAKASPEQLTSARRNVLANGIVATSERDLEIRLRAPMPYLPSFMALWLTAPVRQADVERSGAKWWQDPANYIGNGPFVLSEWTLGKELVFERNPHYRGRSKLKRFVIRIFPEQKDALAAYQRGEIDRLDGVGTTIIGSVSSAGLDRELMTSASGCTTWLLLNSARPPLDDPKVRLALAKSIDRSAYVRALQSFGKPATSFIPEGLPGHDDGDTAQSYDLAAARQLLSESRYAGTETLRHLVWELNATAVAAQPIRKQQADWLAQEWQALGIDTQVLLVDTPTLLQNNRNPATRQAFVGVGWCADYADQADWFSHWFTAAAQRGSSDRGYRNPSVDAMLDEADHALDQARRDDLYMKVSRMVSADVPGIWISYGVYAALEKPWVGGLEKNALDTGGFYHPTEMFVRKH